MSNIINSAAQIYGQDRTDQSVNLAVPRNKFQFQVKIHYHANGAKQTIELKKISEMQMPGHTMKTQTLNQYNKKRTIQTGIDYTPVTLTAYDTRDGEIEKFLIGYNNHYFSGPMSDNSDVMIDDIINENFKSGQSAKGFNLTDNRYYITKIEIIRTSSSDDKNIIEIYNPIITSIQGDTLSYTESAPVQYRIDFTYEGYKTITNGEEVVASETTVAASPQERAVTSIQAANAVQAANPTATATATNANGLSLYKTTISGYNSNMSRDWKTGIVTTTTTTAPTTVTVFDDDGSKTTTTEPSMNIVEVFNPRTGLTTTTTTDPDGNSTVETINSVQPGVSAQDVLAAKDAHAYNESIRWDDPTWDEY
jgi:hypothetical protein